MLRSLSLACTVAALAASPAHAQFNEMIGHSWSRVVGGDEYHVLDVYMKGTAQKDRLLILWNTSISLWAGFGATFFHAAVPGGAMTALPLCYVDQSPIWEVDSYLTLGGEQCTNAGWAMFTPDTPPNFLVNTAFVNGPQGFFIVPPISPANECGPDFMIRVARLTIRDEHWVPNAHVNVSWTVGWAKGYGSGAQFSTIAGTLYYTNTGDDEPWFDAPGEGGPGFPFPPPLPLGSVEGADATFVAPGGWITGFKLAGLQIVDADATASGFPGAWLALGKGDLDGDGDTDFILRQHNAAVVHALIMQNGAASVLQPIGILPNDTWTLIGMGDISSDGRADLVWRNGDGGFGQVRAWIMNGLTVVSNTQIGISPGFEPLAFGDFNDDGRHDVLWRSLLTNTLSVWELAGPLPVSFKTFGNVGPILPSWKVATTADLDGDGDDDLLWRNGTNGNINGWIVQNSGRVAGGLVAPGVSSLWQVAGVSDLDDDGDEDVLWQRLSDGQVNGWIMQGLVRQQGGVVVSGTSQWVPVR
jgi:hypothetical protein